MPHEIQLQTVATKIELVTTNDPDEFEHEVNARLARGLLFHGEMLVVGRHDTINYIQAMVVTELRPTKVPTWTPPQS
jgi:hypothetical protein